MGESRSCIDLIFTDQPNLFIESGVHPSLHEQCHHQIIYGKVSIDNLAPPPFSDNLAPPPFSRRIWFYDRSDISSIRKSIEMFPWRKTFEEVACPHMKVALLNEILLNIFSNFIPSKTVTVRPRQAPWMPVKNFIRRKNGAYITFIRKWSARG